MQLCISCKSISNLSLPCNCALCESCLIRSICRQPNLALVSESIVCPLCTTPISITYLQDNLQRINYNCIVETLSHSKIQSSLQIDHFECPNCMLVSYKQISASCCSKVICPYCLFSYLDSSLLSFQILVQLVLFVSKKVLLVANAIKYFFQFPFYRLCPYPNCQGKKNLFSETSHFSICKNCNRYYCYKCEHMNSYHQTGNDADICEFKITLNIHLSIIVIYFAFIALLKVKYFQIFCFWCLYETIIIIYIVILFAFWSCEYAYCTYLKKVSIILAIISIIGIQLSIYWFWKEWIFIPYCGNTQLCIAILIANYQKIKSLLVCWLYTKYKKY